MANQRSGAQVPRLRLISHKLCPYVQRAVIVAAEKNVPIERVDVDLADKPSWFVELSPTGRTPLLEVTVPGGKIVHLFESAVIAEYLDQISPRPLLPAKALPRARQRAWIEFASATLGTIGQLYSAADLTTFENARQQLAERLRHLEREVAGPWFAGAEFGLVDAAFGPVFRYLHVFSEHAGVHLLRSLPVTAAWATKLSERDSVRNAVDADYPERLVDFVRAKGSFLGGLLAQGPPLAV